MYEAVVILASEYGMCGGEMDGVQRTQFREYVVGADVTSVVVALASSQPRPPTSEHLVKASGTTDAVDALIVMVALPGDQLLTSDSADLRALVTHRAGLVTVVRV